VTPAEQVRALLSSHVASPASDDAVLELSSFELVVLVEELEDAFDVRISAAQVTPENFRSVASIVKLVSK
jgi:acyl carrier protein